MLRYIFTSLVILGFATLVNAQNYSDEGRYSQNTQNQEQTEGTPKKKKEKIPYPNKKRGTAIGIDVSRFFVPLLDNDRYAFEANIKTNFKKRMFFVGSLGFENVSFDDKSYEYKSDGLYGRVGFDYDIFIVDEPNNNDNILFGLRYGFAVQDHGSDNITIEDPYWGNYTTAISSYTVNSHWIELVAGLRTELFNNFYLSFYARLKTKIASNNAEIMEPYRIPGYGRGSRSVTLGFSYIAEYQIPWGNKRLKNKSQSN